MSHASKMPEKKSFAARLTQELNQIERLMTELLDASTILPSRGGYFGTDIIVVPPPNAWGPGDERQLRLQIALRQKFSPWREKFLLLARILPEPMRTEIAPALSLIESWIEKKGGYGVPATITEAKAMFNTQAQVLHALLANLDQAAKGEIMLVPDTNVLVADPDPTRYSTMMGAETYTVLLLPTVLGELDDLKVRHRDENVREKAKCAIKRIKGFRNQGSLHTGVTVNRTVTVRAISREPSFSETLSWLDPTNKDDKIIASTLEIQRNHPGAVVILVTSDINLQNKAEVASVTYLDPPDPPSGQ